MVLKHFEAKNVEKHVVLNHFEAKNVEKHVVLNHFEAKNVEKHVVLEHFWEAAKRQPRGQDASQEWGLGLYNIL